MTKFLLSMLTTGAVLTGAQAYAQDEITFDFYGRADVSLQSSDDGDGSDTELKSNSSRIGVKGGTKLTDDLEVVYQLEWAVDLTDFDADDNLNARDQWIGLRGSFGEIRVGRHDTVLKDMYADVDRFNNYEGDLKVLFEGENRVNNTLMYISPKFYDFSFAGNIILSEGDTQDDGYSMALYYGDDDLDDTNYYLSAAMDRDVDGYDVERLAGYTKVSDATTVGLMWHQQEAVDGSAEADGLLTSASHKIGNFELKAQYQMIDFDTGEDNAWSFGVDYRLAKSTKVYAWYTGRDLDTLANEQRYLGVGIHHRF
ncbi:porin [Pseudidiomarina salilacus]|uniref:porin n=1 Tax=Pseudidiomarina salilacus TaxID=3384452 RepID=UPI003984D5A5